MCAVCVQADKAQLLESSLVLGVQTRAWTCLYRHVHRYEVVRSETSSVLTCAGMYINMCVGVGADVMDMCTDMRIDVCRHVP